MKKTICLILICLFTACNQASEKAKQAAVKECAKYNKLPCDPYCRNKGFRRCYYDKNKYPRGVTSTEECFGVHMASYCKPCFQYTTLAMAGALKEVECEVFYQEIEMKNAECKDCLKSTSKINERSRKKTDHGHQH